MRKQSLVQGYSERHLVFICSNFQEFNQLRRTLCEAINSWPGCPMEAIDLNDNEPESRPPLEVSLDYASSCDVLVLLLGNNYGGKPPGQERSYSHLECMEAWAHGNPRVLPFFLTESPQTLLPARDALQLSDWRKEIEKRHTVSKLDPSRDPADLAMDILAFVSREIYNRLTEEDRDLADSINAADDLLSSLDAVGLSDEELQRLERNAGLKDQTLFRDTREYIDDPIELGNKPAEAAALEKRREANKAIAVGDRQTAIGLLEEAFALHRMDEIVNLQLAKVLASRGIRDELRRASILAVKAARMALHEGHEARGASAYVLASQTSLEAGDLGKATILAKEAVNSAGWLAATHLQLARCLACRGEEAAALEEIERAFRSYPTSLAGIHKEPEFSRMREALVRRKRELSARAAEDARVILLTEAKTTFAFKSVDVDGLGIDRQEVPEENAGVMKAIHLARESGQRQILKLRDRARELAPEWESSDRELEEKIEREYKAARDADGVISDLNERKGKRRLTLKSLDEGWWRLVCQEAGTLLVFTVLSSAFILNVVDLNLTNLRVIAVVAIIALLATVIHFLQGDRERRRSVRRHNLEAEQAFEQEGSRLASAVERASTERRLHVEETDQMKELMATRGTRLEQFIERVTAFERTSLRWYLMSPTRSAHRAKEGDYLRIDSRSSRHDESSFLSDALPPSIREKSALKGGRGPRYQIARLVKVRERGLIAVRWACFFEDFISPKC